MLSNNKQLIFIFILLSISLIPRFLYSADFHFLDPAYYEDQEGNRYPYKFDSYSFMSAAINGQKLDLYGAHFSLFSPEIIKYINLFYYCVSVVLLYRLCLYFCGEIAEVVTAAFAFFPSIIEVSYFGYIDRNVFVNMIILLLFWFTIEFYRKPSKSSLFFVIYFTAVGINSWKGFFVFPIIAVTALILSNGFKKIHILIFIGYIPFIFKIYKKFIGYIKPNSHLLGMVQEVQGFNHNIGFYFLILLNILLIALFLFLYKRNLHETPFLLLIGWVLVLNVGLYISIRHYFLFIYPLFIFLGLLANKIKEPLPMSAAFAFLIICLGFMYSIQHNNTPYMNDLINDNLKQYPYYDSIISWWDNGVLYNYASGVPALYKASPSGTELLGKALLTDNTELSIDFYKSVCKGNCLIIFHSQDLTKKNIMVKYYGLPYSENSTMYKGLYGKIEGLKKIDCYNSYNDKMCLFELVV